jgi:DNA-binding CsgD family transcriptional regulator
MITGQQTFSTDYTQIFMHLFSVGQILCGETHGVADRFCQEVGLVTQGHAELLLHHQSSLEKPPISSLPTAVSFPVQFRDMTYGTLHIASNPAQPANPALPLPVAHLLCQACGLLLYTFELSAFFQGRTQQLSQQANKALTKREREVLILMCRGYDQEAIARTLSITSATVGKHRQNIYERLGVHSEYDALLAAYKLGIFSPIEEILD